MRSIWGSGKSFNLMNSSSIQIHFKIVPDIMRPSTLECGGSTDYFNKAAYLFIDHIGAYTNPGNATNIGGAAREYCVRRSRWIISIVCIRLFGLCSTHVNIHSGRMKLRVDNCVEFGLCSTIKAPFENMF